MSDLVLGDGPAAGSSSRGGLRRGRARHSDGSALSSADLGLRYTYVAFFFSLFFFFFFFFGSVHPFVVSTSLTVASRADAISPCTAIRRSRPRPRTTTTTTIRCRIHLGEVSFIHQGVFLMGRRLISGFLHTEMMLEAEQDEQKQ
jgi:hypothetical protein